jgi:hypothetical protein
MLVERIGGYGHFNPVSAAGDRAPSKKWPAAELAERHLKIGYRSVSKTTQLLSCITHRRSTSDLDRRFSFFIVERYARHESQQHRRRVALR